VAARVKKVAKLLQNSLYKPPQMVENTTVKAYETVFFRTKMKKKVKKSEKKR
jgi:hypothetical protein